MRKKERARTNSSKIPLRNKINYSLFAFIFLALLIVFHTVNNYIILSRTNLPFAYDESGPYAESIEYYNQIKQDPACFPKCITLKQSTYPQFFSIFSAVWFIAFGTSAVYAAMVNSFFLIILIFSAYGIGKKLCNTLVGMLSAFILSFYPGVFGFSRLFLPEFAILSLVALNIFLLLLSDRFKRIIPSLLWGVTFGIGLLIKWTFLLYVIGPFLFVLFSRKKILKDEKTASGINILFAVFLVLIIALPWYIENFLGLISLASSLSGLRAQYLSTIPKSNFAFFMFLTGFNRLLYLFYMKCVLLILFWISVLCLFIRRKESDFFLLSWATPFMIFFIAASINNLKIFVPFLASAAVITASGVYKLFCFFRRTPAARAAKVAICALIMIFCIFQFFFYCYGQKQKGPLYVEIDNKIRRGLMYPLKTDWPIDEILLYLSENAERKTIVFVSFSPILQTIIMESKLQNLNINSVHPLDCYASTSYFNCKVYDYYETFNSAEYVLLVNKTDPYKHDFVLPTNFSKNEELKLQDAWTRQIENFYPVKKFPFENNSEELIIYKRK